MTSRRRQLRLPFAVQQPEDDETLAELLRRMLDGTWTQGHDPGDEDSDR